MHFGCDRFVVEIVSPGFGIGIATKQMHRSCASSLGGLTFFCSGRACDRLATCSKELGAVVFVSIGKAVRVNEVGSDKSRGWIQIITSNAKTSGRLQLSLRPAQIVNVFPTSIWASRAASAKSHAIWNCRPWHQHCSPLCPPV